MLKSSADYWKALFWGEIEKLYPHTKGVPLTYLGGDDAQVSVAYPDRAGGPPRVEASDSSKDELESMLRTMPMHLKKKIPTELKELMTTMGIEF